MPGKLLIVSPNFPPKSTADLHRVRTSLPFYRQFGWEPTVLCVGAKYCDGINDPALASTLPQDVPIIPVAAWEKSRCRKFGFGQLEYRALWPLYREGSRLLRSEKFDVVLFSTTAFLTFVLGRIWRRQFGCKIVYDFQDPWYVGDDIPYTRANAPGGWRKYSAAQTIARFGEPFAVKAADHILSVSPAYTKKLGARYRFLKPDMFTVLPFPAAPRDYEALDAAGGPCATIGEPGRTIWVSVGRAGPDIDQSLEAFFDALVQLRRRDPGFVANLTVAFIGTNYAPANSSTNLVMPIAARFGLEGVVRECAGRIPYFEALSHYRNSDAILLFGSSVADYTPSKLFSCVLARRPILAMLHGDSMAARIAGRFPNVRLAAFRSFTPEPEFADGIQHGFAWLREAQFDAAAIDREIAPWSAEASTQEMCGIFDRLSAVKHPA